VAGYGGEIVVFADEFNLAEPAVLNMLAPPLEGKGLNVIPATGLRVIDLENFRLLPHKMIRHASGAKSYRLHFVIVS
jgi:hypothetical protein